MKRLKKTLFRYVYQFFRVRETYLTKKKNGKFIIKKGGKGGGDNDNDSKNIFGC